MKRDKMTIRNVDAIKTRWGSLTPRGLKMLMILIVIIVVLFGTFSILIFNVGCDERRGIYLKPANLNVNVELKKKKE